MSEDQKTSADYELFHYGVKGMKWGVRKRYKGSAEREAAREKVTKKHTDLKARNRAESEKNYDDLTKKTAEGYSKGGREGRKAYNSAAKDFKTSEKARKQKFKSDMKELKKSDDWKKATKMNKGEMTTTILLGPMFSTNTRFRAQLFNENRKQIIREVDSEDE